MPDIILQRGGNATLLPAGAVPVRLLVGLRWQASAANPPLEADASIFLLTDQQRVRSDDDFIFYNNSTDRDGLVRQITREDGAALGYQDGFIVDLQRLPTAITQLVIGLTLNEAEARQHCFKMLTETGLEIWDQPRQQCLLRYDFSEGVEQETALIVGEFYQRGGNWKFRAISQGFAGGLAAMATHFGVSVETGEDIETPDEVLPPAPPLELVQPMRRSPRSTAQEQLAEPISRLRTGLETWLSSIRAAFDLRQNESGTRLLLDRLLQDALGYPIHDIKTEQNIQGRKADYVLMVDGREALVIEVKRIGMNLKDRQVFQATAYGAYAGIRWALLTNLLEWQLYRISISDKIESHLVFSVDVRTDLDDEAAYHLALLSPEGMRRPALLESLLSRVNALGKESVVRALLHQKVLERVRRILSHQAGCALTFEEVQAAVEKLIVHGDE